MISVDIKADKKQREIKKLVAVTFYNFLEVSSKLEIK